MRSVFDTGPLETVFTMKHPSSIFPSILVLGVLLCLPVSVHAGQRQFAFGKVWFGAKEEIEKIQDIKGTEYQLSHKYTLYFFFAGVYLSDDGYVLQPKSSYGSYYPNSEESIKEFQRAGLLPSPLPQYSIPIWQYLFGYSLWIVVAFVGCGPLLKHLIRRLSGKQFCHSCKLELTPREIEMRVCGCCNARL